MIVTKTTIVKLAKGRQFMTGGHVLECGEICASCGQARASDKIGKVMSSSFNQTDFFLFDSIYICGACKALFSDKDVRSKCLLYLEAGKKQVMAREDVLPFLANPTWPFVISLPYSFQKHHIIHAGISENGQAIVGTDSMPVFLDYKNFEIAAAIMLIAEMLTAGVPRKELQSGKYGIYTRQRYGSLLDKWELNLAPMRPYGVIELLVRYQPSTKTKTKSFIQGGEVFTDMEQKAINLLVSLAYASRYRRENGMEFWSSFFKRRVARHSGKDVNTFFSAVAQSIACDSTLLDLAPIDALIDMDAGTAVMKEIAEKADLLIAAAYTVHKERSEGLSIPKTPKQKAVDNEKLRLI